MPPLKSPPLSRRVLLTTGLCLGLTFTACNPQDYVDGLLDSQSTRFDSSGTQLSETFLNPFFVTGSAQAGGIIVGLSEEEGEKKHFKILRFSYASKVSEEGDTTNAIEQASCDAGPADELGFHFVTDNQDLFFSFENGSEEGFFHLNSFDLDCQPWFPRVEDLEPRLRIVSRDDSTLLGYLVRNKDGDLLFLDPAEREVKILARKVTRDFSVKDSLWTLEKGQIVQRSANDWRDLRRIGEDVTYLALVYFGNPSEPGFIYESKDGIFFFTPRDPNAKLLSETGCQSFYQSGYVTYLEPCEEQRLVIRKIDDLSFVKATGPVVEGPVIRLSFLWNGALLNDFSPLAFVTAQNRTDLTGHLHHAWIDFKSEDSSFDTTIVSSNTLLEGTIARSDWSKETGGDLFLVDPSVTQGTFEPLLSRVIGLFSVGKNTLTHHAIANFDGRIGDLYTYPTSSLASTQLLAQGVAWDPALFQINTTPWSTYNWDPKTSLIPLVTDVKNERGLLRAISYIEDQPQVSDPIEEGVHPRGTHYLQNPRSLLYFKGTALHAYLIDSDLKQKIQDQVHAYLPIQWPSPGLVYSVSEGRDRGIWFTKAR